MKIRPAPFLRHLLVGLALAGPARGAAEDPAAPPLTLVQCIHRALERSFRMEIARYNPGLAQDNLLVARNRFAPTFSASVSQSVGLGGGSRNEGLGASLNVSQPLVTGGTFTAGSSLNRSETTPSFFSPNPSFGSGLTFGLSQPLLQGAGRALSHIPIRQAEIGLENALRSYRGGAMDLVQATENAYYALVGVREQRTVSATGLTLAQNTLAESREREKSGLGTKLDVLQAELSVAQARQTLLQAENAVHAAEDALLAIIGRFEFDGPLGPVRLEERTAPGPSVENSFRLAKLNKPEYVSALAALESGELGVVAAKDGLKPAVGLSLSYNTSGSGDSGAGAVGNAVDRDSSNWGVGLGVSYPWGRVAEKVRYRGAQVALRQQQLGLQQMEQDILQQVRTAVREVVTNTESVKIAALASEISARKYELERRRYTAGLSTSRLVLEAQNDLAGAQVSELQSRFNLQTSLAALRRIEGSSLEYYGITVADPATVPGS